MLSSKQKSFLKGKAHALKPIVQLGQKGMTEGVERETDRALHDHELIKVRLGDVGGTGEDERSARQTTAEHLAKSARAEVVAVVGKLVILYRAHPDRPTLRLPSAKEQ